MIRIALAVLLALHGIAHLVGFAGSWGLLEDAPRRTTILGGRIDFGAGGARVYGLVWLGLAVAFVWAAIGAATAHHTWIHWTPWIAIASLVMSILSWPDSRIGVLVNLVILVWLHFGAAHGWWYAG